MLGTGNSFIDPISFYVPKRTASINLAYPATSFKSASILITGTFGINQAEYDDNYVIVPLSFARDLFEYTDEVTSVDIKLRDQADQTHVINTFKKMLGPGFQVLSMTEQKAELYRINRIEKWMTFLILSFILLIALFNIIGSLSMLILDKQKDARTLSELGADRRLIRRIFMSEGWLIAFSGAVLGVVAGIILCFLQQRFGLLKLGGGGNYIIDYYPVNRELRDILLVLATTLVISLPATWWPVNLYFSKNNKLKNE
jgi:lipoprotein-releasing system permease protein